MYQILLRHDTLQRLLRQGVDAEDCLGHPVSPLSSLDKTLAWWPESATSVGLALEADSAIKVIAPHGLEDLFAVVMQRNPARGSIDASRQRIAQKRCGERWPKVRMIP